MSYDKFRPNTGTIDCLARSFGVNYTNGNNFLNSSIKIVRFINFYAFL